MNRQVLNSDVQTFIKDNLNADVHKIAMGKSPFPEISGQDLANQIASRKKSRQKLPTWFNTEGIYYPALLSVEQCSSEITAAYKATLTKGDQLIDLTGGFGVDSYYFSRNNSLVTHCEINQELSAIAQYNAEQLDQQHTNFICGNGLEYLKQTAQRFTTIYIDPARRSSAGKVFMLKDCSPNVVESLEFLLRKTERLLIKTAPLLDLSAGLKELNQVTAIHIVSVKNECKELIWVLEPGFQGPAQIVCTTLNHSQKQFRFTMGDEQPGAATAVVLAGAYLYEPDVALLKSGAFNLIAERYGLQKLHAQTQLYVSDHIKPSFPGRIFQVEEVMSTAAIKKEKNLVGSVIVRNYPDKAAVLVGKYHIKPDDDQFLIFTTNAREQRIILRSTILQHY